MTGLGPTASAEPKVPLAEPGTKFRPAVLARIIHKRPPKSHDPFAAKGVRASRPSDVRRLTSSQTDPAERERGAPSTPRVRLSGECARAPAQPLALSRSLLLLPVVETTAVSRLPGRQTRGRSVLLPHRPRSQFPPCLPQRLRPLPPSRSLRSTKGDFARKTSATRPRFFAPPRHRRCS
jgi:hypothetical protein